MPPRKRSSATAKATARPTAKVKPTQAVVREQGRIRARKFRDSHRAASGAASSSTVAPPAYASDVVLRRYGNLSVLQNVEWIVRIGSAPSAAGARAPLAGIVSNVCARATNRWSVELYRWRILVYVLRRERELYLAHLREDACGISLRYDETPGRFFHRALGPVSSSVQVRCVTTVHGAEQPLMELLPQLRRPVRGTWPGLLAALDLPSLRLDELRGDGSSWKFVLSVPDGAASNRGVVRGVVAKCRPFRRVVVVFAVCWAHTLSNATKWALGPLFPFGPLLRVSHVLQARSFRSAVPFCQSRLDTIEPGYSVADRSIGRVVWGHFLERLFSDKGPFSDSGSGVAHAQRVELFLRLWPDGPPSPFRQWRHSPGSCVEDYAGATRVLFRRSLPSPILSRWYSVENFCWRLLAVYSFGALSHLLPVECEDLRFWPGDNPALPLMEPALYAAQSRGRMRRVREFTSSAAYLRCVFAAVVSSIPRFEFARQLHSRPSGGDDIVGIAAACKAALDATEKVLAGNDVVVEYFLNREDAHADLRAYAYRALVAAVLYLGERNLPYTSKLWQIVRGERPMAELDSVLREAYCCGDSGFEEKIRSHLDGLSEAGRAVAIVSLRPMMISLGNAYCHGGGSVNLVSESAFSHLRSLSLKLPYRPMQLCTAQRELAIRVLRRWHQSWFDEYAQRVYGGLRNMRTVCCKPVSKVNGFSAFCRAMQANVDSGRYMWSTLTACLKKKWAEIAIETNAEATAARNALLARVAEVSDSGPMGSKHRSMPVSVDDIYAEINDDSGELRHLWTRTAIREYRASIEKDCGPLRLSDRELSVVNGVRLTGDACPRCKDDRRSVLAEMKPLWVAANEAYGTPGAKMKGVACGCVYESEIIWHDLVLITLKPQRLLCVPIEITALNADVVLQRGFAPRSGRAILSGLFDGRSSCMMDMCSSRGCPPTVVFAEKRGVVSSSGGWSIEFHSTVTVRRLDLPRNDVARDRPTVTSDPTISLSASAIALMFGDAEGPARRRAPSGVSVDSLVSIHTVDFLGESECAGSSVPSVGAEASSDRELAHALRSENHEDVIVASQAGHPRLTAEQQRVLAAQIGGAIDLVRYAVAIRVYEGCVVVYWVASEKEKHWDEYVKASRAIKSIRGCLPITASKSSSIPKHSIEGCAERAAQWQQWHTAWIYNVAPTCELPPCMVLPPRILLPGHPRSARAVESSSDDGRSATSEDNGVNSDGLAASSSVDTDTSVGTLASR